MSRSERLLHLLEVLRRHRVPVAGPVLAQELGVSIRTLYRDIASLQVQGADIAGERGLGYVLRPGFTLPPLMFSIDELEALVLGSRWVARHTGDRGLSRAAESALAKIATVLPAGLRAELDSSTLMVGQGADLPSPIDPRTIRQAVRQQHKLRIAYTALVGAASTRTVWPLAIGFFEGAQVLVAWCEERDDFRHFRLDRITTAEDLGERYRERRSSLLRAWREQQGIPAPAGI